LRVVVLGRVRTAAAVGSRARVTEHRTRARRNRLECASAARRRDCPRERAGCRRGGSRPEEWRRRGARRRRQRQSLSGRTLQLPAVRTAQRLRAHGRERRLRLAANGCHARSRRAPGALPLCRFSER
jgi:hypothetical protein